MTMILKKCELFYVPQGTVVELYATTLHYTPITVIDSLKPFVYC